MKLGAKEKRLRAGKFSQAVAAHVSDMVEQRGIPMVVVARTLGVSEATAARLLSGERPMPIAALAAIAVLLDVNVLSLIPVDALKTELAGKGA